MTRNGSAWTRRQRLLEGLRRLRLRESQVQPLVLVFEDLHWIDGETQAFLDHLMESLPTARLPAWPPRTASYSRRHPGRARRPRPADQHGSGSALLGVRHRPDEVDG